MMIKFKQLTDSWRTWKAIDGAHDGEPVRHARASRFGEDAARELDAVLRAAGAAERREGPGRLRWRVLSVISSQSKAQRKAQAMPPSFQQMRPMLVGAVAILAIAISAALWFTGGQAGTTSRPGIAQDDSPPNRLGDLRERFGAWRAEQIPQTSVGREASAVMTDVKAAWTFFRARMITPIPFPSSSSAVEPIARPSGA